MDIRNHISLHGTSTLLAVAIFLTIAGFAFKISAVPFHFWTPDTYEGAPTPVTAFLSVASKAGGFVALLTIIRVGFFPSQDSWEPILWVLAAASIIFGNLVALKQTNIIRMLAYSSIAQGGFILVPLAVAGDNDAARASFEAVVIYLLIYGAMNLGAFAVAIAVARRTGTAEIDSYAGLGQTSPWLAITMSVFLFSLAGIPAVRGLVRQVRDVPSRARRQLAVGDRPRSHRRGRFGDRVLLLRGGRPQDVVRRTGHRSGPPRRSRCRPRSASPSGSPWSWWSSSGSTRRSSPASASSRFRSDSLALRSVAASGDLSDRALAAVSGLRGSPFCVRPRAGLTGSGHE